MRPTAVHVDTLVLSGAHSRLDPELVRRLAEEILAAQLDGRPTRSGRGVEDEVARTVADAVRTAIESSGGGR